MRCCVSFCESNREDVSPPASTTEQIGFYAFPRSRPELAAWRRALGEQGSVPAGAAVCSRHFLREDMCGDGQLRAGAVPTTAQVCVICLDTGCKMFSMSKYNLKEAYEHLTGHPLFNVGNLKHTLCVECAQRLTNFEKFRDKSLRARDVMMDLVKQYKVITIQHIAALRPLKSPLAQSTLSTLGVDPCDLHVLEDSAVKIEPDMHMPWDRDTQADDCTAVKTEPNLHVVTAWTSVDEADNSTELDPSADPKLLDNALCTMLGTRMPHEEDTWDPLKCELTLQDTDCGEEISGEHEYNEHERTRRETTLARDGCTAADGSLPSGLSVKNEESIHLNVKMEPTEEMEQVLGNQTTSQNPVQSTEERKRVLRTQTTSQNPIPSTEAVEPNLAKDVIAFSCQICQYKCQYNLELAEHMKNHVPLHCSDGELEDEGHLSKKKRMRGESRNWIFVRKFSYIGSAEDAVSAENTWAIRTTHTTKEGKKRFYRCKKVPRKGVQCAAEIFLLFEADTAAVSLYRRDCEHDHDSIKKDYGYGICDETKSEINRLLDLHLKPKSILEHLKKKSVPQITKRQLDNYLADRRRIKLWMEYTPHP